MSGTVSAEIKNGYLRKLIYSRNILRFPEQSFTFDRKLIDKEKPNFNCIIITLPELGAIYEITKEDFFRYAHLYNYGNGTGYRVATRYFSRRGEQRKLV